MDDSPYYLEFHGLSDGAFKAKGLSPIHPVSIVIKINREQGAQATSPSLVEQKNASVDRGVLQTQNILGGVSGTTFYGSLHVDGLWITPSLRHQRWGTKLMQEVEQIGKRRGAKFATLNTMDWEALPFYEKLGYSIEFTRQGYEKSSKMFMLRKNL
jgi:ribosomal protein S18 acetylase RimI-like enzyme